MMNRLFLTATSAATALLVSAGAADAAIVTNTYAIQATNFGRVAGTAGSTAPFASINGQFTVTFDTTTNSAGSLLTTLGLPAPYGVGLNYTYQSGIDRLNVSQTPSSSINDGPFTPGGIYFSIQGASTATPSFRNIVNGFVLVTNAAGNAQFNTSNASVSIVPVETPAVPEPATWAMMLVGFGGIGFAMRRRKSKVTTNIAYA